MKVTLKPQTEKRINEMVHRGEFDSADSVVEQAVAFFLDYEQEEMDQAEFHDVETAVEEGVQQGARGEGVSLEEFDRNMRSSASISV